VSVLWLFNTKGNGAALSVTEAGDTVAATSAVPVSLSASITESGDTVAASSTVLVSASASITEAGDSVTAGSAASLPLLFTQPGTVSAVVLVSASASIIEDADNSAAIDTLTAVNAGGYIIARRPRKRPRIESGRRPTQDDALAPKSAEQVKREIAYDNDFLLMVG
jgi:hypothetical protein